MKVPQKHLVNSEAQRAGPGEGENSGRALRVAVTLGQPSAPDQAGLRLPLHKLTSSCGWSEVPSAPDSLKKGIRRIQRTREVRELFKGQTRK